MATARHRLFHTSAKLAPLLTRETLHTALAASAHWLEEATRSTGEADLCHRTALYRADGSVTWHFPHSNTSELIATWLDLAEILGDNRHRQHALAYAKRYVGDPVRGLYRGPHPEAQGLAWYWRDDATYTGGYSMRAPEVLRRLTLLDGSPCWGEAARLIGETFLARQLPSGLVNMVGWSPEGGWGHPDSIGSRYVYTVATFATLYDQTSDPRYRAAYEKSLAALETMQQADGSFFHTYHPETLEIPERSTKPHFFAYIFNALMEAWRVFEDERVLESARRLADYTARLFYYRQTIPYSVNPHYETDAAEADSAVHDCANGLLWLHEVTGEAEWLDVGTKLWHQAWLTQAHTPELLHAHGALLRGVRPDPSADSGHHSSYIHLQHDAERVARCEIWFQANFVFAGARLLRLLRKRPA